MAKGKKTMREKVESIINDETLPTYRIAKESGLWVNTITRLRNGDAKLGNIRFEVAEKLAELYDKLHQEE